MKGSSGRRPKAKRGAVPVVKSATEAVLICTILTLLPLKQSIYLNYFLREYLNYSFERALGLTSPEST